MAAAPGAPVAQVPPRLQEEILQELRALRQLVTPRAAAAGDPDAALEDAVNSVRRLLSELLESRTDALLRDLVMVRNAVADPARSDRVGALARLDRVLAQLGATQFSAQKLDYVDPAIYEIAAERHQADVLDGVVVETLRPGFRSASGMVIARACVAVNRR